MRDESAPDPQRSARRTPEPSVRSDVDDFRVSIGIHGEELDPDQITALLRCEPDDSHRRGERRGPRSPPMPRSAWFVEGEGVAPTEPEAVLAEILSRLSAEPAIWNGLHERFTVTQKFGLFLDAPRRGFELSPSILQRVGELGISLGFDIYGPEGPTIGGPVGAGGEDADDDTDGDDEDDEATDAGLPADAPTPAPPPPRGKLIRVGGRIDRTRATLRIHGSPLDSDWLTELLRCAPTEVIRNTAARAPRTDVRPDTWLLSTEGESPRDPEDVLGRLLAMLPADPAILDRVRERHAVSLLLELHLYTWNRGFDLPPAIVRRVARLGLGLRFDIHASHDPDLEPPRTYEELGWKPRNEL